MNLYCLGLDNNFLALTSKTSNQWTIDQLNVIKIKNICLPRNHDSQNKRKQWQSMNLIKKLAQNI